MKHTDKILICYNKPLLNYANYSGKNSEEINFASETEVKDNLDIIINNLSLYYNTINVLEVDTDIIDTIAKIKSFSADICLNFVESINGNSQYESNFAGLLELMDVKFTGNTFLTLATCLDKITAKHILNANNIPTPKFSVKKAGGSEILIDNLNFPLIIKPALEDAGIGISENSVVYTKDELNKQIEYLDKLYKQDLLIEEYIDGREFNISLLGNNILPISEICFTLPNNLPDIVSYQAKWETESVYYKNTTPNVPADISANIEKLLTETAINTFNSLNCDSYARVDIRLSKNNIPYVIDINPNPDIMPNSGFVNSAKAAGIGYSELLHNILTFAKYRNSDD